MTATVMKMFIQSLLFVQRAAQLFALPRAWKARGSHSGQSNKEKLNL